MAVTTFSGPVKAGNIFNTTGTTLSENVSNQGQATMVQVYALSQAADDPVWTDITIPANSQITRIAVLITVAAAGGVGGIHFGRNDSVGSNYQWFVASLNGNALGLVEGVPATDATRWKDIGAIDCHISYNWTSSTGDVGRAVFIIEYIQNNNLTA